MKQNEDLLEPLDDMHTSVDVLVDMARAIVDHPLEITTTETDSMILVEVKPDSETKDGAKLCGSKGYVVGMFKQYASILTARYPKIIQFELNG